MNLISTIDKDVLDSLVHFWGTITKDESKKNELTRNASFPYWLNIYVLSYEMFVYLTRGTKTLM